MLFVINYDSEIRPAPLLFHQHALPSSFTPSYVLSSSFYVTFCRCIVPSCTFPLFFLTEVEVKSLKQCIGWARREQTQPQICLSCSRGGLGVGFLIKCF